MTTQQTEREIWKIFGIKPEGDFGLLVEAANEWALVGAYQERVKINSGRNGMLVKGPDGNLVKEQWYNDHRPRREQ